jgi:crossover junction endodeoxyribonuclease RusA
VKRYDYTLPWPPTVNHYRAIVNNRLITSSDGRRYKRDVLAALLSQGFRGQSDGFHKPDRVAVVIEAYPPTRREVDLDNRLKPTLDALDDAGMFDDDSQIDDLRIVRGPVVAGGKLIVTLSSLGADG